MRDAMYDLSILERMTKDIRGLLNLGNEDSRDEREDDHVGLWDEKVKEVAAGKAYGIVDDEDEDEWGK